jgi:hypothetical protein
MSAIQPSYPAIHEVTTHVAVGRTQVMAHAAGLAELADSMPGTPVTARWPWIAASVAKPSAHETPWMVSVRCGHRITAAAVLLDDTSGTVRRTSLAGTADGHRGALVATDNEQASRLGGALADALLSELREFAIGPVSEGPAVAALLQNLPIGLIVDEVSIPVVRTGRGLAAGVSHGTARTLRKARNRIAKDEVRGDIVTTSDRQEISALLPLLEMISRDRDHAGGRLSPLDDPERRRLWHRRIRALAADDSVALSVLRLDGDLAAYVLGIDDGDCYRVLEGRYVARWARYSPGRVLEASVLHRAITDGRFSLFDWMTDVAPETLLASNSVDQQVTIRGRT